MKANCQDGGSRVKLGARFSQRSALLSAWPSLLPSPSSTLRSLPSALLPAQIGTPHWCICYNFHNNNNSRNDHGQQVVTESWQLSEHLGMAGQAKGGRLLRRRRWIRIWPHAVLWSFVSCQQSQKFMTRGRVMITMFVGASVSSF